MSRIKGKNTIPELLVRKFLFSNGFRYRIHDKNLCGSPDIVLKKYKSIIFVNGCFFHGHENCKYYKLPKTNVEFWENKISRNIERDIKNTRELISKGWNVITIWSCDLSKEKVDETIGKLIYELRTNL